MTNRGIEANDLYRLKTVANPAVSPNGEKCIFVETFINSKNHEYHSNLLMLDLTGTKQISQWTYGEYRDESPKWSPNGNQIAFISNRTGVSQLFLINEHGGETKQITNFEDGVEQFTWSPDGEKLAFSISLKTTEVVIEEMKYKLDSKGMWNDTYKHIAIINLDTGQYEQMTSGNYDYHLQSWSPNGESIAVTADLNENRDDSFIQDVYLLDIHTKQLHKKTSNGYFEHVTWSPDGRYLAMIGHQREYESATLVKLWIYDLETESRNCLTCDWDVVVGDFTIGDFQQGVVSQGVLWADDNYSFYFQASDHGNTGLYYGNLDGEIYPALLDDQHIYNFAIDGNDLAVLAISKTNQPSDLYSLKITTGELTKLTSINEEVLSGITFSTVEGFYFKSEEGLNVQGWLVYPLNYNPEHKYPLILEVHGGLHAMYGNTYIHEFHVLAAQGYAVLYTNPRGSHGYGQDFVNAVRGDYGGNDYKDLMNAVDFVLENYTFLDCNRLGVTAGSYGGYMTNWIVSHTDRFKAAVTQRSISNWISFYGVSDTEWQLQTDLSDIEKLWKHSPLAYVDRIKTPLLIMHSEKDYRCSIEQAEQLFIALKRSKKITKFLRFPETNHDLSRSGNPKLRLERLEAITEWFNLYV